MNIYFKDLNIGQNYILFTNNYFSKPYLLLIWGLNRISTNSINTILNIELIKTLMILSRISLKANDSIKKK